MNKIIKSSIVAIGVVSGNELFL